MADPLYELLAPYFDNETSPPSPRDPQTAGYLSRLSTLSFADLTTNEPASLLHSAQSHLRNLQALSKRSHKAVISSSSHLANLSSLLPAFGSQAETLQKDVPNLENAASEFATKYDRSSENAVLDRRKRAALLSRNVDRVSDVLDLPSLLSSTVTAAQASSTGTTSAAGSATSYASALDLHAHIKRLKALYPQSELIGNISSQSELEMQNLATVLITSLQSPSLKLAAAMRTVGWLRRVAPDLTEDLQSSAKPATLSTKSLSLSPTTINNDGALGSLFLVCRLKTLHETLDALEPLRDLADQDTSSRQKQIGAKDAAKQSGSFSTAGTQSERYLKRYIEIFREQSFAILSMYKSIFPANLPEPDHSKGGDKHASADPLLPAPSAVSTFAVHLVDMLESTLRTYLPNIMDKTSRESLLTQVLYCAGSLGRLGADFGMMVALLEDDLAEQDADQDLAAEPEWVQVMKKHRIQASRLEILSRGVGTARKGSMDGVSPQASSPTPAA
ncbi:Conserved oligomeric Golgi complex subunit 8 [Pseudocercospora fuligena]|uniref:Conserved oligomeric Golgi complex subunit 8 n=1 Tax=Pseudocercospora fuligena TaxID=685502 RepID=A0A8H6RDH0_9PEZI|nr:Conserved oligomeric Golgi complex subunit 8 [Pseudocercospora fuligena]